MIQYFSHPMSSPQAETDAERWVEGRQQDVLRQVHENKMKAATP